ncbi:MAG: DUF342 domain-containing protein [Burkholderiales bacterium]|nr:DUF342 domain-containing protein [Burkholderiales bacterium]
MAEVDDQDTNRTLGNAGSPPAAEPPAGGAPGAAVPEEVVAATPPRVEVEVAADGLSARVRLIPGSDAALPALPEVMAALAAAGVVSGIDEAALRDACQRSGEQELLAAQGVPAKPGEDVRFDVLIEDHRDRSPQVDELGLVDFRELGEVPIVDTGQALMRRVPPTRAEAGLTVRGEPLDAPAGRDERFPPALQGVAIDSADANLLRAARKGLPVRVGNAMTVEPLFRIPRVDMASGNIHFDGTVQIDGDVMPGMKVQAGGDVLVRGTVDGGDIEAAGDIHITGGAIAHARLQAQGSVSVRFVESAVVAAVLAIQVEDTALHSELAAGAQITIGKGSRGRLAGGLASARAGITVPHLGSASVGSTRVRVGHDPSLEQRRTELLARLNTEREQVHKLEQLVQHLVHHGDPKGLMGRVQPAFAQAQQALAGSLQEKIDLDQQVQALRRATVVVGVRLEGDVELAICHRICRPDEALRAGSFSLREDDHIVHTDAHGLAVPVLSL